MSKAETKKEKITTKAIELLGDSSGGIRYGELVAKLKAAFPDTPENTIHGTIWDLHVQIPDKVYKPVRGLFRHAKFKEVSIEPTPSPKIKEEQFYEPFKNWLLKEVEECSRAISLGGSKFKDKWGTPDVIGILEPGPGDIFTPPLEVTSAEIKINTDSLIEAFGQACAYKLFSHRSYLVVPKGSSPEDRDRLDSLCSIFGVGLVLFDSSNPQNPDFEIRVRAQKHEPDRYYANRCLKQIAEELYKK